MWCDASFGGDSLPYLGGFVEWRQGPVAWNAGKAKFVPGSSCHIELAALVRMVKEGIFAYPALEDFSEPNTVRGPISTFTDNKGCNYT